MGIPIFVPLLCFALLRALLGNLFPLSADESYYWLWSKHLALSYVDHPPMVAYLNFLFTFGRENLFAIRLGAAIITTLTSFFIYLLAKELFNEKVAFWSAFLFQIIPHYLIVWLTMFVELPLALFWTISLYLLTFIIKKNQPNLWYLLAITVGLGYLSKYTMFLFWPCLVLFFILSPENRFWLRKKETYLSFLFSLLFFLPVLYWNSRHNWVSFAFHGARTASAPWLENFLPFIGDQLVHFTPFLLFTLYPIFRNIVASKNFGNREVHSQVSGHKLLFCFSFPILCLFLCLSLKIKVWAHWPAIGYIAALPLTVNYLLENKKSLKKFMAWIFLFSSLLFIILFFVAPGVLLHQKDYAQNYLINQNIPGDLKLFAKTNVSSSLLEFYSKRPVYLATGFLKIGSPWGEAQYNLWGIPALAKGETILYYGEDNQGLREKALKYFAKIEALPPVRLNLIEDYIQNNYTLLKLLNFKGGADHP